jgi:hypothetical protein
MRKHERRTEYKAYKTMIIIMCLLNLLAIGGLAFFELRYSYMLNNPIVMEDDGNLCVTLMPLDKEEMEALSPMDEQPKNVRI